MMSEANSPIGAPTFFELSREECDALLARQYVARLAFTFQDRVDVEPIHYVYANGKLNFRTGPGSKLTVLTHHPWVALEVDEISALFDWRSVVVHGTVYALTDSGTDEERGAYHEAVRALRQLVPTAFTPTDPTPSRGVVLQLYIDRVVGRGARTR